MPVFCLPGYLLVYPLLLYVDDTWHNIFLLPFYPFSPELDGNKSQAIR